MKVIVTGGNGYIASLTKLLNFVEKKLDAPVTELPSCN